MSVQKASETLSLSGRTGRPCLLVLRLENERQAGAASSAPLQFSSQSPGARAAEAVVNAEPELGWTAHPRYLRRSASTHIPEAPKPASMLSGYIRYDIGVGYNGVERDRQGRSTTTMATTTSTTTPTPSAPVSPSASTPVRNRARHPARLRADQPRPTSTPTPSMSMTSPTVRSPRLRTSSSSTTPTSSWGGFRARWQAPSFAVLDLSPGYSLPASQNDEVSSPYGPFRHPSARLHLHRRQRLLRRGCSRRRLGHPSTRSTATSRTWSAVSATPPAGVASPARRRLRPPSMKSGPSRAASSFNAMEGLTLFAMAGWKSNGDDGYDNNWYAQWEGELGPCGSAAPGPSTEDHALNVDALRLR